jgi:hypothetical protein
MCSLIEAYETFSDPPIVAERKHKKRKRYVLPPPETFEGATAAPVDPDRPANRWRGPGELLSGGDESTSISQILNGATPSNSYFPHPTSDVDDETVYNLDPQWAKMFTETSAPSWIKDRMPDRQSEVPLIPSAWVDGQSTLWKNVAPGSDLDVRGAQTLAEGRVEALQKKLDAMFARLDDMESQKRNGTNMELLMFIFGGFFLLLVLDLIVKQGTTASLALNNVSVIARNAVARRIP